MATGGRAGSGEDLSGQLKCLTVSRLTLPNAAAEIGVDRNDGSATPLVRMANFHTMRLPPAAAGVTSVNSPNCLSPGRGDLGVEGVAVDVLGGVFVPDEELLVQRHRASRQDGGARRLRVVGLGAGVGDLLQRTAPVQRRSAG